MKSQSGRMMHVIRVVRVQPQPYLSLPSQSYSIRGGKTGVSLRRERGESVEGESGEKNMESKEQQNKKTG